LRSLLKLTLFLRADIFRVWLHSLEKHRFLAKLLRYIEGLLGALAALVLFALLANVLVSVALRYLFSAGFVGTEELGIWLHIAMISLGAPLSLGSALAMRFDVLTRILPQRFSPITQSLADIFTVLTSLLLLFGTGDIIASLGGTSPTLGAPEWLRFAFLGAGGAFVLIILSLRRIIEGNVLGLVASLLIGALIYLAVPHLNVQTDLPPSLFLTLIAALGIALSAPLSHSFLAAGFVAIAFGSSLPEPAIVATTVSGMSKFLLLAIPFFLLVGTLLTASGVANQLVRFAASLVGHRRAGLAQTTLLTSFLFSGASGSSVANAAFGAATFQPALVKHGYPPAQAGAMIAATSVLDNVIPPSIAFLILAAATNLSVGSLLVGGFFAGGLMALCLAIAFHLTAHAQVKQSKATSKERWSAAFAAIPAFGLGVIVVLGIRMGLVTTTEAAALAALYTIGLAVWRKLGAASLFAGFRQAAIEGAAIGLLIGAAGPFAFLLAVDDVAGWITHLVTLLGGSALAVLLLSNIMLLLVGLVLDIGAAILLFAPILLPAAIAAGIDPIHFGVILVVNLMISGLTPPVGILVFVVSGVTHVAVAELFRAVMPYLFALIISLAILCALALLI
jgi:tripartite ATP-independent transporter DctM subunit